jgi:hypothetical protein
MDEREVQVRLHETVIDCRPCALHHANVATSRNTFIESSCCSTCPAVLCPRAAAAAGQLHAPDLLGHHMLLAGGWPEARHDLCNSRPRLVLRPALTASHIHDAGDNRAESDEAAPAGDQRP